MYPEEFMTRTEVDLVKEVGALTEAVGRNEQQVAEYKLENARLRHRLEKEEAAYDALAEKLTDEEAESAEWNRTAKSWQDSFVRAKIRHDILVGSLKDRLALAEHSQIEAMFRARVKENRLLRDKLAATEQALAQAVEDLLKVDEYAAAADAGSPLANLRSLSSHLSDIMKSFESSFPWGAKHAMYEAQMSISGIIVHLRTEEDLND